MVRTIIKRDGREEAFDKRKISAGIYCAMKSAADGELQDADRVADAVSGILGRKYSVSEKSPSINEVQDVVEKKLMDYGFSAAAKAYILYRADRTRVRETNSRLMRTIDEITRKDARLSNMKRDNANIDGNTSMGAMLQIGAAGAKAYNELYLLRPEHAKAFRDGEIHIHDFDFYSLTTTCCQIDILRLFHGGFSTGHGYLREPQSIQSYAALAAIAIQSNQNDQHGGQSIPNFDYGMAEGVAKTYRKAFIQTLTDMVEDELDRDEMKNEIRSLIIDCESVSSQPVRMEGNGEPDGILKKRLNEKYGISSERCEKILEKVRKRSWRTTDRATFQAMEGFVHNLNTMHSRAGAQTPFSSINYGTDTSPEGRMVIRNILAALDAGLGHGETCIFPIHIFKVKEGVNYDLDDPNYDLFRESCRVSARRLFPNFTFLDAPYNLRYYKPGHPETEVATMGCRTRVMGNVYDPSKQIAYSRGNLSFTSINLPRLALESGGSETKFYERLQEMLELVAQQLLDRFEIQAEKHIYNYPFLMGQGIWLDSDKLTTKDTLREVLKHGTLSIGFIGLAETLTVLYGQHHGQSEEVQKKGLEIIAYMRRFCDQKSQEIRMNFTLLATPAEGLSGRFVKMDQKLFGKISGVTDREYYTNSFHIPVWFPISVYDKIRLEGPYHALCNAGHISYVELDGDTAKNVEAFESVVRCMHDNGIGYGSINHPVDRDPVCGYVGVIGDVCPRCGRREGEMISEEKLDELRKQYPEITTFLGIE